MTFGMTTATFALSHVVLSLAGIFSGFVVMFGLLIGKRLDAWTGLFLATHRGDLRDRFGFPFDPSFAIPSSRHDIAVTLCISIPAIITTRQSVLGPI
jgi:hypothetical protein